MELFDEFPSVKKSRASINHTFLFTDHDVEKFCMSLAGRSRVRHADHATMH